ncbi:MAG: SpoIIE family protein phosphatase [Pseudomonadota bacterium]
MFRNRGISVKLAALVLVSSLVILAVVLGYNYRVSRKLIVGLAEENSRNLGLEVAAFIASELKPVETLVTNIALAMEGSVMDEDELLSLTRRIVTDNPSVFGLAIALEPYSLAEDRLFFTAYSYHGPSGIITTALGGPDYMYFAMDWYQLPKELAKPVWTEPYHDTGGGNSLMTTFAAPFYRTVNGKKTFAGVVTADILLDWLQERCSRVRLYDTGYCALLSARGTFLYHPVKRLIMNETVFSIAEETDDTRFWNIGRNMIGGKSEFIELDNIYKGKPGFLMTLPLAMGNWSLGLFFPRAEVLRDVTVLSGNMLVMGLCGFLVLTVAVVLIARQITRPLQQLSDTAMAIAGGNLSARLRVLDRDDEVGRLSRAFGHMQTSLAAYIRDLTDTTAQKERIEAELRIARDIQMGILPKLFPAFPDHDEFDIFATIQPAKEVGGDLYDFFFVDDTHFCFLIGDVSGKGVPAAFFMAITKTLLKVMATRETAPGTILERVNNDLSGENDSCMFVTLFLAILDLETGFVNYACAGHNPPAMLTGQGAFWLPVFNQPMAGAMEGMTYTTGQTLLALGETMVLYTDGVTEAMNPDGELYSDQRLLDLLADLKGSTAGQDAASIVQAVNASVEGFVKDAEQSDDITLLAITYTGSNPVDQTRN